MGLLVNNELSYKLDELDSKLPAVIVLDRTPFYGEMGGQVGDTGWIVGPKGRFEVTDTRIEDDFILHVGHLREGKIEYKDPVEATVDSPRRQAIRRAHSATHLLQYALRKTLGTQTHQKGSKVEADLLRFDFNHDHALSAEQLATIETEVNARAIEAVPVAVEADAEGRGPEARCDDALRREVPGHRPRGLDGRIQQGTLRRHAPGQHGADGPDEDHRRREHRQGHPPHHGLDRSGGASSGCSATKPYCGGSR